MTNSDDDRSFEDILYIFSNIIFFEVVNALPDRFALGIIYATERAQVWALVYM